MKQFILSFFILVFFANQAFADKPVKIAIIGDTEKHLADMDLLTVKLSEDDNIHVLERSDWDYLLRERQISKSKIGQSSIKIGKLLGADGLIILTEEEIKGKKYLFTKLVAVNDGVILDSIVSPIKEKKEEFSLGESIEHRFKPKLAKLKGKNEKRITISMLNIRSAISSPEMLAIEKDLNAIFAQRLMKEQNVLVSERWNIAEASFEKNLEGQDGGFKTGNVVLDGTIELMDEKNVEIKLSITTPDGKKQDLTISGPKKDLGKLSEVLTTKCLKVAKVAKSTIEWDRSKEALEYFKEAQWAYNAGLFFKAAQSAESAWALGYRKPELTLLRMLSYSEAAYPLMSKKGSTNRHYKDLVDVTKTDKHLDAAIMAIEIFKHYFEDPYLNGVKIPQIKGARKYDWVDKGEDVVSNLSKLLKTYYEQKCLNKDEEKQAFLKKSLKRTNAFCLKLAVDKNLFADSIISLANFAPFWCNSYEETQKMYKEALGMDCKGYNCAKKMIREWLCGVNSGGFIDRSGNYSEATRNKLFNDFIKTLLESNDLREKTDGYILSILNTDRNWASSIEGKYKIRRLYYLAKLTETYNKNPKLYWNHDLVIPESIFRKIIKYNDKDFLYNYLLGCFKTLKNNKKKHRHFREVRNVFNIKNISQKQAKELYPLMNEYLGGNWANFGNMQQDLRKRSIESQRKVLSPDWEWDTRKVKDVYRFQSNAFKIYQDKLFMLFFKTKYDIKAVPNVPLSTEFILVILDQDHKFSVCKSPVFDFAKMPKHGKKMSVSHKPLIAVENKNVIVAHQGRFYLCDISKNNWKHLPVSVKNYLSILFKNNKIYAGFSPERGNRFYDSGLLEIDIETEKEKLLFGSRIKPAKTLLDNVKPYRMTFTTIGERYLTMYIASNRYIYDIKNKALKKIEDMNSSFFKENFKFAILSLGRKEKIKRIDLYLKKPSDTSSAIYVYHKLATRLHKKLKQTKCPLFPIPQRPKTAIPKNPPLGKVFGNTIIDMETDRIYTMNYGSTDIKTTYVKYPIWTQKDFVKYWALKGISSTNTIDDAFQDFDQYQYRDGILLVHSDFTGGDFFLLFFKKDSILKLVNGKSSPEDQQ